MWGSFWGNLTGLRILAHDDTATVVYNAVMLVVKLHDRNNVETNTISSWVVLTIVAQGWAYSPIRKRQTRVHNIYNTLQYEMTNKRIEGAVVVNIFMKTERSVWNRVGGTAGNRPKPQLQERVFDILD